MRVFLRRLVVFTGFVGVLWGATAVCSGVLAIPGAPDSSGWLLLAIGVTVTLVSSLAAWWGLHARVVDFTSSPAGDELLAQAALRGTNGRADGGSPVAPE